MGLQIGGNHYKSLAIQPVEYAYYNKMGAIEGEVLKYITRHRWKGGAEDLRKAIHSLEMLIEMEYENENPYQHPKHPAEDVSGTDDELEQARNI